MVVQIAVALRDMFSGPARAIAGSAGNLGRVFSALGSSARGVGTSLSRTFSGVKGRLSKIMGAIGTVVRVAMVALATALAGATVAVRSAISRFAEFEQSMKTVQVIAGASATQMMSLSATARTVGVDYGYTASQVSSAMLEMAKAGYETNEILAASPGILALARAGLIDVATATDYATSIAAAFGYEADELGVVIDTLAEASRWGKAEIDDLGTSFKYVAPIAAAAGMSLQEMAATLELLAESGIKGSMAGTYLRFAISSLLSPSKKAQKILDNYNISIMDASGNLLGMDEIVTQLADTEISTAEITEIFGERASTAIIALIGTIRETPAALSELTASIEEAGGTAETMATEQMATLQGSLLKTKAAINEAWISLGERLSPEITKFADYLSSTLIPKLSKELGPAMGDLVSSFGDLLGTLKETGIIDAMVRALGGLLKVLGGIARAISMVIRGWRRFFYWAGKALGEATAGLPTGGWTPTYYTPGAGAPTAAALPGGWGLMQRGGFGVARGPTPFVAGEAGIPELFGFLPLTAAIRRDLRGRRPLHVNIPIHIAIPFTGEELDYRIETVIDGKTGEILERAISKVI